VELEDIKIFRTGESALSPIETGFIKVRGTLVQVRSADGFKHGDHKYISLFTAGETGHIYADFDCASFSMDSTVWLMQILACRTSGDLYGDGLILQLNPNETFRRIGIFQSFRKGTLRLLSRQHQDILTGEESQS